MGKSSDSKISILRPATPRLPTVKCQLSTSDAGMSATPNGPPTTKATSTSFNPAGPSTRRTPTSGGYRPTAIDTDVSRKPRAAPSDRHTVTTSSAPGGSKRAERHTIATTRTGAGPSGTVERHTITTTRTGVRPCGTAERHTATTSSGPGGSKRAEGHNVSATLEGDRPTSTDTYGIGNAHSTPEGGRPTSTSTDRSGHAYSTAGDGEIRTCDRPPPGTSTVPPTSVSPVPTLQRVEPDSIWTIDTVGPTSVATSTEDAINHESVAAVTAEPDSIYPIYTVGPTSVTTSTEDAVDCESVAPVTAEPESIYPVYTVGPMSVTTTIAKLPSVVTLSATIVPSEIEGEGGGNGLPIPFTIPGNNTGAMTVGPEATPAGLGMGFLAGALLVKELAVKK
jgi:hypothetical protein